MKRFNLARFSLRAFATSVLIGAPYYVFIQSGSAAVPQELFIAAWGAASAVLGVEVVKAAGVTVVRKSDEPTEADLNVMAARTRVLNAQAAAREQETSRG